MTHSFPTLRSSDLRPGYYTYADSSGNFEITNLKEGTYRLYALKEENDSRLYDDTKELIGFLEEPLTLQGDTLLPKIHLATMEQAQLEVLNERNQDARLTRSEEHTSELQSLMRISYAVFCLKQKKQTRQTNNY